MPYLTNNQRTTDAWSDLWNMKIVNTKQRTLNYLQQAMKSRLLRGQHYTCDVCLGRLVEAVKQYFDNGPVGLDLIRLQHTHIHTHTPLVTSKYASACDGLRVG